MSEPTRDRPTARRRVAPRRLAALASGVVALAGLALLALVPLQYATLTREGFDAACLASVGRVPAEEGELLRGSWSWWPLGASCDWTLLDGTVIRILPDWSTTAVAITGAALLLVGIVGAALALLVRRRARQAPAEGSGS
ncbi:hypothetical protein NB037_14150 [Rathayibacter sp. ZW T2_19]|uniref:Uncharacterized protein n=1 Tax=Rathayibacter rubneri TaxID=2950106 RepID=A0A9X2DYK2_9MICO|nr:hypothetical protein [Rathayibacter rubneri]MCM6763562.1 hypothetical protein [Rathayibacter rubneri]